MRKFKVFFSFVFTTASFAQDSGFELKTIDEVMQGIDELLSGVDADNEPQKYTDPSKTLLLPTDQSLDRPFRLENELMPKNLQPTEKEESATTNSSLLQAPQTLDPAPVTPLKTNDRKSGVRTNSLDYSSASIDDLLREVESLELPEFIQPLELPGSDLATPMPSPTTVPLESTPSKDVILSPILQKSIGDNAPVQDIDEYTVLGESIDYEMKEKIREAIMATRMASGGSDNPYVTRSVFKATSYCNRVLGRLNGVNHKRYRRDILLSLIGMHEKNQAWVDAAKSYERYLEEFVP